MAFESGYESTIALLVSPWDTSITVKTAPTITTWRAYLKSWSQKEWISFTGVSSTTLTGVTRQLSSTADPATSWGSWYTWIAGSKIVIVAMHDQLVGEDDDNTFTGDNTHSGDEVFSWSLRVPVYADFTARDAAITSPANGMLVYNTATGKTEQYIAWAWADVDTWGTFSNASTTVAWKVEEWTLAQWRAWTWTWETWARTFLTPDTIAQIIQEWSWIYLGASAEWDDDYVVTWTPTVSALVTGMRIRWLADVANTGACTLTIDATSTTSIKTKDWNDPQDWVVRVGMNEAIYDWTNFVLQHEDFASTANKWIQENATDAEALARSSTSRTITASNLAIVWKIVPLQTTRDITATTWTVNIAHWQWVAPRYIQIWWMATPDQSSWEPYYSHWFSDGTNHYCTNYWVDDSDGSSATEAENNTSFCIKYVVWDGSWSTDDKRRQTATASFDATNVALTRTWTDIWAFWWSWTMYITILAHF